MTPQEKTLDKIKKLLAKANNDATTDEEAAAFAAKAAELAARAQLDLGEIDWENRKDESPIGRFSFWPPDYGVPYKKVRVAWMQDIASMICRHHQCRIVVYPGSNTFDIIGRKGQVEIAAYLVSYLIRFVLDQCEREYVRFFHKCRREDRVEDARGFKDSWRDAFIMTVRRRLQKMRDDLELEYKGSKALVRLKNELTLADEWMKDNMNLRRGRGLTRRSGGNSAGYQKGRAAAKHVDLDGRAVKKGKTTPTKKIR